MNIGALLAGLLSGIIAAMGMGGGAVLLIYLSLFTAIPPESARGINLLFFIPIGIFSVISYSAGGNIKWKRLWPVILGGVLGAAAGVFLSGLISGDLLKKIFGGFLCLIGLFEVFSKKQK